VADSPFTPTVIPPEATRELAEASRAMRAAVVDPRALASISEAIRGIEKRIVGDLASFRKAADALTLTPPVVTPRMTEEVATALGAISGRNSERLAEIVKGFEFSKLDGLALATQFAPRIAETLSHFQMRPEVVAGIQEALGTARAAALSDLAPSAASVIAEAAVAAETTAAEEVAAETVIALDLSPLEQRELRTLVITLIVGFTALSATIRESRELALAGETLSILATLVAIYWLLTSEREP